MAKKKALLIGINYVGTSSALQGCIHDAHNMKQFLLQHGYAEEDITVMTDETPGDLLPTRANILKQLMALIVSDGTSKLFFHYSGHGSYVPDMDGDECDQRDECLVPLDYRKSGLLLDDELVCVLQCMGADSSLTCLIDSCFSGTALDLNYSAFRRASTFCLLRSTQKKKRFRSSVIMLSGCTDRQTSADAYADGTYQGAMTRSFLNVVNENKNYEQLLVAMRNDLKTRGFRQRPMLSASHRFDLTTLISF